MRKSIRLFSILAMALVMAFSFVFAGVTLAKADVNVDFGATAGASVYLLGDENDLGINFKVKVSKEDYAALKSENANKNVWFGSVIANGYYSTELITVQTPDANVVWNIKDGAFTDLDENYYSYNTSLVMDIEAEYAKYLTTVAQGVTPYTLGEFKVQILFQPWVAVPLYAVFEGEFDAATANIVYGTGSDVRTMFGVANGVDVAEEDVPETFADKYQVVVGETTDKEIYIYPDGTVSGDQTVITNNTVIATLGADGEAIYVSNGVLFPAFSDKAIGEVAPGGQTVITTVSIPNQTSFDITIARHKATVIDAVIDSLAADAQGKLYIPEATDEDRAEFTGIFVDGVNVLKADGTLDLTLANKKVGDKFSAMIVSAEDNVMINEVEVYDYVFEDTAESRELMASIFRGRAEDNGVLDGSYALAENLNFNHFALDEEGNKTYDADENVLYSNKEAFNANIGFQRQIDTDPDGNPVYETVKNTFSGTFDGRGYALNNVLMDAPGGAFYGLFGYTAGDGATIKNLAINDVYKFESKTDVNQDKSYEAFLFATNAGVEAELTLQNLYIYRRLTSAQSSGSLLYQGFGANKPALNKINMENVIIVYNNDYEGNKQNPAFYNYDQTLGAGSVVNNVYIVSNTSCGNFKLSKEDAANSANYAFFKLEKVGDAYDYTTTLETKLNEFKAAEKDLSGFDSKYWTVVYDENGAMPVWDSISNLPKLYTASGAEVSEIVTAGVDEAFVVLAQDANGEPLDVELVSSDPERVVVYDNVIVIEGIGGYSATVTATVNGISVIYNVTVDNRSTVVTDEEVVLSKVDGKLYFVKDAREILYQSVVYGDVELVTEKGIDLSTITGEKGEVISLNVSAEDAKYVLTNVKVYTGAFVNTAKSRQAMSEEFSGADKITTNHSAYCSAKTLTGYYILLEDITFDYSNLPTDNTDAKGFDATGATHELFNNTNDSRKNTFKATLDGRGYSLNNIGILGQSSSIFGFAGDGATIKNIAFNHIDVYKNTAVKEGDETVFQYYTVTGIATGAKFFYTVESPDVNITLENVYINDDNANDNKTYGSLFIYTPYTTQTIEGSTIYNAYSIGNWSFNNVIIINAIGPIFTGGNGHAIEDDGINIPQYGAVKDTDVVLNTYVVTTANMARNAATLTANTRGENFVKGSALPTDADYSKFSSEYWSIVAGVPVWKSLTVVAQ